MKPRIQIVRCAESFPHDYEPRQNGAGFVLIGTVAIGLGLYVLSLLITGG